MSKPPSGKWALSYVPSFANFVLVNVGDGHEFFQRLLRKGIIVRSMVSYGLPAYVRVSLGTLEQNARFIAELPAALEGLVDFKKAAATGPDKTPAHPIAPPDPEPDKAPEKVPEPDPSPNPDHDPFETDPEPEPESEPLPEPFSALALAGMTTFGHVAILGPGLIGGSLALALSERRLAGRLSIYARTDEQLGEAKAKIPEAFVTRDVLAAVREADLIVLCVPIEAMAPLVRQFVAALKPGTLVTDVGSVKGSVENEIAPLLQGNAHWVGGHPMAGGEKSGFAAADAGLFGGATVILTPTAATAAPALEKVRQFWLALGARPIDLDPVAHDVAVAQVSHVPHLVAAELLRNVAAESLLAAGPGLRDTTRVASGSPDLWTEIIWANRVAIGETLGPLIQQLEEAREMLNQGEKSRLHETLKNAHDLRSKLLQTRP